MSTWLAPPSIHVRVVAQRARLVRAVLILLVLISLVGLVTAPVVAHPSWPVVTIHSGLLIFAVLALALQSRAPRWWNGGVVVSLVSFGVTIFAFWALGSPSSVALLAFVTVQLLTGALWGPRAAVVVSGLMLVLTAGAVARPDLLAHNPPAKSFVGYWIGFASLTVVNVTLIVLAARTVRELLLTLRDSEGRLTSLISSLPDGLVLLNIDGTVASVNRAAQRLIGADVVGRHVADVVGLDRDSKQRARRLVEHSISGFGNDERFTLERDGTELHLQARLGAVPMGAGGAGIILALRDITGQVRAQREQEQLRHQLLRQQKLESVGRLAGGIAHDFNNLLTIIRANAEFLENDRTGELSDSQVESLEDLKQAAARCASFTQRLLTLSRSHEFGRQEIVPDTIARDVVAVFARTLVPNIEIDTELEAPRACVEANNAELEAAVLNLVINANDALGDSGTIRIKSAISDLSPEDPIYLPVPQRGPYWTLSVIDDGSGMDEATIERATEPFFTTKEAGRGTGLGLATVYQMMKQLDGGMHIESAPGLGTTVTLFIPRSATLAAVEPLHPERRPPVVDRRQILLVEDDPSVRAATRRALEHEGYDVDAVESAASALQWLDNNGAPDLLLSDILLPGMSGTDLAERAAERFPKLSILHISGFTGTDADRPRHPVLTKPFAPSELKAFVGEHLAAKAPRTQEAP